MSLVAKCRRLFVVSVRVQSAELRESSLKSIAIICSSVELLSLYADNESLSSSLSSTSHCVDHLTSLDCATLTSLYVGQAAARDADTCFQSLRQMSSPANRKKTSGNHVTSSPTSTWRSTTSNGEHKSVSKQMIYKAPTSIKNQGALGVGGH